VTSVTVSSKGTGRPFTVSTPSTVQALPLRWTLAERNATAGWRPASRNSRDRTWGSRMKFLVENEAEETSAVTLDCSAGSATVSSPRVTANVPRTRASPNMCLVTKVTDELAGSMA
jgi:hypothetical protein